MKIMIFLVARLVEFLQCLLVIKNACSLMAVQFPWKGLDGVICTTLGEAETVVFSAP